MKKTILVFRDGVHEYTITVEKEKKGEILTIYPSDNPSWLIPKDEPLAQIIDTGNGIVFDRTIHKTKELPYWEIECLSLLINYNHDTSGFPSKFTFMDEEEAKQPCLPSTEAENPLKEAEAELQACAIKIDNALKIINSLK